MRTVWTFNSAGQIVFGPESARRTGEICREIGGSRCMVVTDRTLLGAWVAGPVLDSLQAAGLEVCVFEEGEPEPSIAAALACRQMAERVRPDVIIGLGGGSNMDLAKITAVLLAHGGQPLDYAGDCKVPGPVAPLVCIPTTAGTGSEVSGASVLLDQERAVKFGVLSNHLRPRVAIVDPLLTVTCPPRVTADSGIDALTHAVEALTAVENAEFPLPPGEVTIYQGRHPYGNLLAEEAIRLVGRHLRRAFEDGHDLAAREGMHLAALFGGLAFSNVGVALVHAMEYPVGGAVHCSHGLGNGLLLPYVMEFNRPARVETFARIADLLGVETCGMGPEEASLAAIQAVRDLRKAIHIPDRLRDIGVKEDQLPGFARTTAGIQRILRVNPRFPSLEEVEGVFRAAW